MIATDALRVAKGYSTDAHATMKGFETRLAAHNSRLGDLRAHRNDHWNIWTFAQATARESVAVTIDVIVGGEFDSDAARWAALLDTARGALVTLTDESVNHDDKFAELRADAWESLLRVTDAL